MTTAGRLALVPVRWPDGGEENFLGPEISALGTANLSVDVVPLRPRRTDRSTAPGRVDLHRQRAISPDTIRALVRWTRGDTPRIRSAVRRVSGPRIGSIARTLAVLPKACWLATHVERSGADHVHAYWGSSPAAAAMIASELTATPWSMTLHRHDISTAQNLEAKGSSAMAVRTVSDHGLQRAHEAGLPSNTGTVVHLPIHLPDGPPVRPSGSEGFRLLCPAHQRRRKRVHDVLRALAHATMAGHDVSLQLAGKSSARSRWKLRRLAERLGIADRVELLGYVPHRALLDRYRSGSIDAVILASDDEGLPISLIEAMAHGLPAIASDIPGNREAVGAAGLLAPVGRPDLLGEAIGRVAGDESLRSSLGRAAADRASRGFGPRATLPPLLDQVICLPSIVAPDP